MKFLTACASIVAGLSFALLAGCASESTDVASADKTQPQCEKTEASTGSFIARKNCSKDAAVTQVDAKNVMDTLNSHRAAPASH